MSDPKRWREPGGAPDHLRDLVRSASATRPMAAADRARAAASIAKLAAKPAAMTLAGALGAKGLVAIVGTGLALSAVPVARRVWATHAVATTAPSHAHRRAVGGVSAVRDVPAVAPSRRRCPNRTGPSHRR